MPKYTLTLYVTGQTSSSAKAIANLQKICHKMSMKYSLNVIDVLESPQLAERDNILATPMLVKEYPLPSRRIIGDLSQSEKVISSLEVN